MNIFEEFINKLRTIVPGNKGVVVEKNLDKGIDEALASDIIQFIRDIVKVTEGRRELQAVYDRMAKDSRIGAAMELLVDESVQPDLIKNKIYWVESEDSEVETRLNMVLDTIKFDERSMNYIYHIIKDGGLYLKTFKTEFSNDENLKGKLGLYYEVVDDYNSIQELTKYGDTVGFHKSKKTDIVDTKKENVQRNRPPENVDDEDKDEIIGVDEYIHVINDRANHRENVELKYIDSDGNKKIEKFKVKWGTSYLETIVEIFLIIEFLELLLLSVRFGRSQVYRIFKLEVGSASKAETAHMLNEIKMKLSTSEAIDNNANTSIVTRKPIPYGKNIYISTRNGKGDVQQELIGGDFNIRDIVDFDYFLNKLYAGLRVPKSYLGEEEATGGLGSTSLVKLDARFARLVNTYKDLGRQTAEQILNSYCNLTGNTSYIGKFEVKYQKPTTADDVDRREDLATSIDIATNLKELLESIDGYNLTPEDKAELLVGRILGLPELLPEDTNGGIKGQVDNRPKGTPEGTYEY